MSFFYVVIGQNGGHVISSCFDLDWCVQDGRAQGMYVDTNGKGYRPIVKFAFKEGRVQHCIPLHGLN